MDVIEISGTRETLLSNVINSYSALQIPAYWRADDFLTSNLAAFPLSVYQNELELDDAHPLDKVFGRRANPNQTSHAFLKTWYHHGEHYGNGYAYIQRDDLDSTPIALWNLLPEDVTPYRLVPETGNLFETQIWYWHLPSKRPFPAADVLHYKPHISHDGLIGYNPSQMFLPTFSRAQSLEVYQTKFLQKGSMIKGSIELPAGTPKEQQAEIIANLKNFQASTSQRDIMLLSGGAKLVNQTLRPVDSELTAQDVAIIKKIAQIKGVDPMFLYDSSGTKYNAASVEAIGQDVVRFTFRPRLELLEPELSTKLLSEDELDAGLWIRYDTSALLRGDTAVEMAVTTSGVAGGIITRNEGRVEIGRAPVDDPSADKLLVPTAVASESTSQAESETHSAQPQPDHYASLRPLLDDAISRVEAKAEKALATAMRKPEGERTIAVNVLADQQASYAAEAIEPVAKAMSAIAGRALDVDMIGERYAAEIRKRAAGQTITPLAELMGDTNAAA